MWRILHGRITRCIEQTSSSTFHRHYCNSQLPQNNQILVPEITQILKNKKWKKLIKSANLKKKLNPDVIRSVLHLNESSNLERLLSFFQWSKHKVGIHQDLNIHSFLAVLLCSNSLYSRTSSVLENVINFGLPPLDVLKSIDGCCKESRKSDLVIFGLLMDKYRENGYLFEAASVVFAHNNKDLDCMPSLFYCNRLLTDLLKAGNFKLFWRVCNAMREANVTFDTFTYTSMVNAHCKEADISDANFRVFWRECIILKFDHVLFGLLMDKYREKGYLLEAASVVFAHNKDLHCVPSLFYCNNLLKDLVKTSNFKLFWRVCNTMREANVTFNASTYTCMLNAHCREGNVSDAKKVFAEMEEKGHCPNMITYNYLMKGLFRAGHADEAIKLKKSMFAKSLAPNLYIYTTIVNGLHAANRFREAIMVLAEMTEMGVKPDAVVYEALLDCYLKHDDMDKVSKKKDTKDAKGIDVALCSTLLHGLCECGKMEKAHELVDEMTREGIEPDLRTYTLLIEGHCQVGNVDTVLELLEEMKKKSLAPVESTYCLITDCLFHNKYLDSAMFSLQDLITKNGKRNAHAWRILLMNYFRKGHLQQVRKILEAMHEQRIIPATPQYIIVMKDLCKALKMGAAQSCLVEMLHRGLIPDQDTYEAFIIGYCGKGKLQNADRYLFEMLHHGFKPNKAIFSALISANCKSGKVSEAFGVFRRMLALGVFEVRDAYLVLLRALLVNKKILEAAEVISELHGRNLVADVSSYDVLICYFVKHSEIEKAFSLYEESQNRGIRPNLHARNHLIAGLFRAGQTERAKTIFDIILKEGPRPNKATYTAMISGFAEVGQLSEAFGLFDSMTLRGLSPNKIIYNALFDGCCKTGNLQKAQDLLQEMVQMGIASTKAFNTLIDGFLKDGIVPETKQLLKKMIEGCVELDQDTYTMLIEALCLNGKYDKALELLLEMGEKGFGLNRSTCRAIAHSFSLKGNTDTDEVCLVIKAMTRFCWISDSTTLSDLLKDSEVGSLMTNDSSEELAERNQNTASSEDAENVLKQVG